MKLLVVNVNVHQPTNHMHMIEYQTLLQQWRCPKFSASTCLLTEKLRSTAGCPWDNIRTCLTTCHNLLNALLLLTVSQNKISILSVPSLLGEDWKSDYLLLSLATTSSMYLVCSLVITSATSSRTRVMKFKDFQAPSTSSTFKALNLGEKYSSTFMDAWELWILLSI